MGASVHGWVADQGQKQVHQQTPKGSHTPNSTGMPRFIEVKSPVLGVKSYSPVKAEEQQGETVKQLSPLGPPSARLGLHNRIHSEELKTFHENKDCPSLTAYTSDALFVPRL
ncbi:hypothetical protein G7K_4621-t1 [Saitoella complicata NRRL Y-17804]|uniref:Uncharacterized protein n=1 Tax=Saitoella complicata (strain BCRC 22490 / CBS 7301 / JCM 7358 / NBRC 10748 / NRRL Y-17804) TaxID=698492 RepID=A0A0E9NKU5_SAICN|nr:hypothetical protein G7K_4621-t1 [Saitoella complicata NRRL Y-17804]